MREQRTCGGCGGSETLFRVKADPAFCEPDTLIEAATARQALNAWERRFPGMLPLSVAPASADCPVCAGRGTVDAKASVADAAADAQALWAMAFGQPIAKDLVAAMARKDEPYLWVTNARFAWSAVPGLRGDR